MPVYKHKIYQLKRKREIFETHSVKSLVNRLTELLEEPLTTKIEIRCVEELVDPLHPSSKQSLAEKFPEIAKLWDFEKNDGSTPQDVYPYSNKKKWWLCPKGHSFQQKVDVLTKGGKCPYCMGRIADVGKNDLATLYPELAKEWHPTKNGDLTPSSVTIHTIKKFWWKCSKGHEWNEDIGHRLRRKSGCPFCYGTYLIKGENDIETLYPEIAKEWHSCKNGNLKPSDCTVRTFNNVWWTCGECGTSYKASVFRRINGAQKCPNCYHSNDNILSIKQSYKGYETIRRTARKKGADKKT